MAKLSEKAQKVLTYAQAHNDEVLTHISIAEALVLSPQAVTGTITGLQKRGLMERIDPEEGKVKIVRCTPEGLAFDVNAED